MPLFGLGPLFTAILTSATTFFLNLNVSMLAFKFLFYGAIISLYVAFIVSSIALVNGFRVAMPSQFAFAFGFIPNSVFGMFGAYMASIVAKRLLDFKTLFILSSVKK